MKTKQFMKRSFAMMLCVVLLVSCWVFTAPSANAATPGTTYNYTVKIETTNSADMADNNDQTVILYGKGSNGTGADEVIFNDTAVNYDYFESENTLTKTGSSEFFPTKVTIKLKFAWSGLWISRKWEGKITISANSVTLYSAAIAIEGANSWGQSEATGEVEVSAADYPRLTNVVLTQKGPTALTVPRTDQEPVKCDVAAVCVDQFNVILVNKDPSIVTEPANQNIEINQGKMTIKAGANSANGSDTSYRVVASQGGHSDSYTFTLTNAKYNYAFQDVAGNEIASGQLKYGQTPTAPATPTKASDATYHYNFTKWSPDLSNLTKDTTYKPVFTSEKHVFNTYDSDNNATCTKDGTRTSTCTCGYKHTVTDVDTAFNHLINGESAYVPSVTKQPTCTQKGEMTYTCSLCGDSYKEPIEATGHSYVPQVVAPTCLEGGYTNNVCSKCQDTYQSNPTDALGHDWGEGTVLTAPTCEEDGLKKYTCSRCPAEQTEVLEKLGHSFNKNKWTIVSYPTCYADGSRYAPCEREGCGKTITEVLPQLTHDWSEWSIVKDPTCSETGLKQRICSLCGDPEEITLDALGHDWDLKTVAPSDSTPGKMYFKCNTCGEINACKLNSHGEAEREENVGGASLDVDSAALAIPTTSFNAYTRQESNRYDYSVRGASLRIDSNLADDIQTIRFAASMTIPEGATIVDYGFVYMWAKDFRKPSTFVIGGSTKVKELSARDGHSSSFQTAEGTVKTYNIVIPVGIDDWDEDILARPYITYTFAGQTFTVYDEYYAQRSVDTIAQAVMDSAKESRMVKEYISSKIINR